MKDRIIYQILIGIKYKMQESLKQKDKGKLVKNMPTIVASNGIGGSIIG